VSLIGTFAVFPWSGYRFKTTVDCSVSSLAVGLVVDDAIVVVEASSITSS